MSPFRNILRLTSGDVLAKALYFLSFVYLARVLGVESYGSLQFAISILMYFTLVGDGGLEVWATRQTARAEDLRQLVAQVTALRLLLSGLAFAALLALLPILPEANGLRAILLLFGLSLPVQAVTLKWYWLGRERMGPAAKGLVVAQVVFAAAVFGLVHRPEDALWVPVLRVVGDLAMAAYYAWRYAAEQGGLPFSLSLRGTRGVLAQAMPIGAIHALGILNYDFDSVLLGILLGPMAVGWYSAAYRPVTVALAVPLTYFAGLFPALSRTYAESQEAFGEIAERSLRLICLVALPVGVGTTLLAEPVMLLLYGAEYRQGVPALQILGWSAALVMLRGTYRQVLLAAGKARLDLRNAVVATAVNVGLNLALIPAYGIIGAAVATVAADVVWLGLAVLVSGSYLTPGALARSLSYPAGAALAMGLCMVATQALVWPAQALLGGAAYASVLLAMGQGNPRRWVQVRPA
jgi:O-antigen/teichoic acid export membrane protein